MSKRSAPDNARKRKASRIEPRGLSREEAADYIGISTTKFDELVKDGRMPEPHALDARRLWCRNELDDAFDALPRVTKALEADPWLSIAA